MVWEVGPVVGVPRGNVRGLLRVCIVCAHGCALRGVCPREGCVPWAGAGSLSGCVCVCVCVCVRACWCVRVGAAEGEGSWAASLSSLDRAPEKI